MLRKIVSFLSDLSNKSLECLVEFMFIIMAIAVFVQVLFRYILHQPLFWSEEFPRFILIWLIFLGSVLAMKNRSHISIPMLVNLLAPRKRMWVQCFANMLTLLFLWVVVWEGVTVSKVTFSHRSAALQMPAGILYLAAPVGAGIMILYLLRQTIELFRGKQEEGAERKDK